MAFSTTLRCSSSLLFRPSNNSIALPQSSSSSLSFRSSPSLFNRKKSLSIRSATLEAPASGGVAPAVSLTDNALKHLSKMRSERNEDLCLRIGVKQGGCSGMSYTMEFEKRENARPDDSIIEYNGFVIVCDPKSLLFIFGMQLDYSDALIGGGFSFKNPNATQTCGCGKSFNAEM
ncbi:iron-sulfur assembly protein IscA, chloroplastic isoform X2 [Lycium ferocissimum]|uniref:iron-sulfur assembly protein IscA, chloroplastic isoform X2 n=1 Tax=Lycium ferocissimum TaxID=112874 RepID=UPI002814B465|nr:iron-sulfur assembly protein IscA, chloroplastic isoform X2 [Lycium ferocissimum]